MITIIPATFPQRTLRGNNHCIRNGNRVLKFPAVFNGAHHAKEDGVKGIRKGVGQYYPPKKGGNWLRGTRQAGPSKGSPAATRSIVHRHGYTEPFHCMGYSTGNHSQGVSLHRKLHFACLHREIIPSGILWMAIAIARNMPTVGSCNAATNVAKPLNKPLC